MRRRRGTTAEEEEDVGGGSRAGGETEEVSKGVLRNDMDGGEKEGKQEQPRTGCSFLALPHSEMRRQPAATMDLPLKAAVICC